MKKLFLIVSLTIFLSCNCQNTSNRRSTLDSPAIDTSSYSATNEDAEYEATEDETRESLNDIRFDGWTTKEWADNEYIRAVRKYIDAYNNGEFEDPYLDEYKEYIQGKFVIYDISPFTWGGVLIEISFYDYPDKVFVAMVYSHVDDNRVVSNYECRSLTYEDLDLKITQEEIRQFLKECPEQKMW